jgi:hypothetical protein
MLHVVENAAEAFGLHSVCGSEKRYRGSSA